ncbi:thiamine biosynthesis lipoprotein [Natranaerovirga hydrolytica]|uniref:FAD:protein FMN transferase n=1 Tax=Natranaerovirga hydrolytica TaxID=680378 RepID=A0A4R1MTR4_9FIRM|nr:FAD:protein FMN transferase [Natranaerovirga hydrolytica]TCK93363.1 thiamine biosynthesis lipoprotein [Natranaerovirga hydrolytica]
MKLKMIVLIIIAIMLVGCGNNLERKSELNYGLGTLNRITIYDESNNDSRELFKEMFEVINEVERVFSKNLSESEVSKINNHSGLEKVQVSEEVTYVVSRSIEHAKMSKGIFDVTIGPIINLWDIGGDAPRVPTKEEIQDLLELVNYTKIELDEDNHTVKLLEENMVLDLGGIAKGYAADQVALYMKENGIEHGIVNLGGDIVTIGAKPDNEPWAIGLQDPQSGSGESIGALLLEDESVVTSGIYERYIEEQDAFYHHMIDPNTGYPFENELLSVTIISELAIDADALSTAAFGMGLKDGYAFIESLEEVKGIFITEDNEIYLTSGVEDIFQLTNTKSYMIKEMQ